MSDGKVVPPWQVSFPAEKKRDMFTTACSGNERMGRVLEQLVFTASWEAKNQGLESCTAVTFTSSHKVMMGKLNFNISHKTFIAYRKQFDAWGYISLAPYSREIAVNFTAIQGGFTNPPTRQPSPRKAKSCNVAKESLPHHDRVELQLSEEKDRIIAELTEKVVTLQLNVVELQEKVVILQQKVSSVTTLQQRLEELEKLLDEQKLNSPIYYQDILPRYITNKESAYATHPPTLDSQPTTENLVNRAMQENNAVAHPSAHTETISVLQKQAPLLAELPASAVAPAQKKDNCTTPAYQATTEERIAHDADISLDKPLSHAACPATGVAAHEKRGRVEPHKARNGAAQAAASRAGQGKAKVGEEANSSASRKSKKPAVEELYAAASPQVHAVIRQWQEIFKKGVPLSPGLIEAATILAAYEPEPGELAACRLWMYANDRNGWYRRVGINLGTLAKGEFEKFRSLAEMPMSEGISSFDDPNYRAETDKRYALDCTFKEAVYA